MRSRSGAAALVLVASLVWIEARAQTAAPRPARSGALLPGGDARQPVLVDADKLEWFDRDQKAIYTGSVVARQGEATLKSSRLTIFMSRQDKAAGAAKTPASGDPKTPAQSEAKTPVSADAGAPAGPGQGEIERMEADGPVELIQKDQTATGDRGEYSRADNTVTLIGNVTLTQGGNVTVGTRLVYDIDSRQAQVENPRGLFAPRAQPGASGSPSQAPAPQR
jgi:lipopolysaccharide export system protein LptA